MSRLQSAAGRVPQGWSFGHWPLRRKLAAALALPVILAFVFGGLRVQTDFDAARQLSRAADTVLVIGPVVDYNLAVQRLAAASSVGGAGTIASIHQYEDAAANLRIAIKGDNVPESVKKNATTALSYGKAVRNAVTQKGYQDVVIDRSGSTATLMSTAVADLGLSDDTDSAKLVVNLQDAITAQRAMTGEQLNLANSDDASGAMRAIGQVGVETAALTRLQATTSPSSASASQVRQLLNENGRRNYTLLQGDLDKVSIQNLATYFTDSNAGYSALMDGQLKSLETNLRNRAAEHRTDAITNAALIGVALLAALVFALGLLRSLLTPIRAVRSGALDIANRRLPEAVAAIRDGGEPPAFEPIGVSTHEEMGQLARAVDDLHSQALVLAGEQARLRVQVGHMFETLSRRSTSLIDQQLTLIERLESDEEDPKRLQSLFRLDHLAARMRRNSDSLLVLAGTSTRRGVSGAISVSDAVRAAVSEVENYERIDIGDTSNDKVLGAVGSDLIHLVAELVDNALAYSPPTTRVALRGARTPEGGLLIEVTDRGLGMPPKDLAALNDRLANGGDITADTARRMGLFVVGSLAKRHGIAVRLRRNGDDKQGITVSVHLPAGLLADADTQTDRPRPAATTSVDAPATPSTPAPSAVGGKTKSGLPTRVRGASGAPSTAGTSPVPGAAKKVLPTRTPGAHGPGVGGGLPVPVKPVIEGAEPAEAGSTPNGDSNGHEANGHEPNGHEAPAAETTATETHAPSTRGKAGKGRRPAKAGWTPVETPGAAAAQDDEVAAEASTDVVADAPVESPDTTVESPDATVESPDATVESPDATVESPDATVESVDTAVADTAVADTAVADTAVADTATAEEAVADETTSDEGVAADAKVREAGTDEAQTEDVKTDEARTDESAPEAPVALSPSGLPVRKPRATGITEYREFEDAPAAPADSTDEARPAGVTAAPAKGSRLMNWLPGRAAKAAEAARLEAEANEPRPMPSNLSAWLDHRAKLVEAAKARETGVDEPVADDASSLDGEDVHVPAEWVAEAKAADEAKGDDGVVQARTTEPVQPTDDGGAGAPEGGLPTRVPGASASTAAAESAVPEGPAHLGRPAVRAHNSSFFGARRRGPVETPTAVEPEPQTAPVAETASPAIDAEASQVDAPRADVPVAEVEAPVAELEVATLEVQAPEVEAAVTEAAELDVPVAETAEPDAPVAEAAPTTNLNDTPIFRAMMSRWLTDEPAQGEDDDWAPTEVDQAWSAAARVEEAQPLEESSAGLPMRRPGTLLIPGTTDEEAPTPAAPAASRRDPETIRRNLNRHQKGVSAARTEAQDGTHREEADVHH